MPDFWPACGYRLLTVGGDGRLTVTDAFLRSYLTRPELAPIPESCPAELALHDALLANPRLPVAPATLAAVSDPDARENYGIWLRFRARLLTANSLEAAYMNLFQGDGVDVPPLFVDGLTQVLLRHILGEQAAPVEARVAEMLFRTQKIAVTDDGAVMARDAEVITRNPLQVPCLTDKYWITFPERNGKYLAATLRLVRESAARLQHVPYVDHESPQGLLQLEEENVKQCLYYARTRLGL